MVLHYMDCLSHFLVWQPLKFFFIGFLSMSSHLWLNLLEHYVFGWKVVDATIEG